MKKITKLPHIDTVLLIITLFLVIFGTLMVFSSSTVMSAMRWDAPYAFFVKQLFWVFVGTAAMAFFSQYDFKNFQKYSRIILLIAVIFLILVLVIGTEKGGAKRWFRLGMLSFQPAELAKIAVIMALADFFDRKKSRINKLTALLPAFLMLLVPVGLIALQPDIGIPIVIVSVSLMLMYSAGARFSHVFGLFSILIPVLILEILRKPYRIERMKNFFLSWGSVESTSYQINQSIMAFGSGGFWGKGFAGSQMKLFHLPEPHTDFIFPVIGEELGFIGAFVLIVFFVVFAWRGWAISRNSQNFFGSLLALGITWLIAVQAFFNMGVAIGVLPAKGLPLPFVSSGGTSLFINLVCVGILLNISKYGVNPNSVGMRR